MDLFTRILFEQLVNRTGQCYVVLPSCMEKHIKELVQAINKIKPKKAVYVVDNVTDIHDVHTVILERILTLRDKSDRVYIWKRNSPKQPDSSFFQPVSCFIGEYFPSPDLGELNIDTLATLAVDVLKEKIIGEDLQNTFRTTLKHVIDISIEMFRLEGNMHHDPTSEWIWWTDGCLSHIANILNDLNSIIERVEPEKIRPGLAWELFKSCGVPIVGDNKVCGNLDSPPILHENFRTDNFARFWKETICQEYLLVPEQRVKLFAEIDNAIDNYHDGNSWRKFNWDDDSLNPNTIWRNAATKLDASQLIESDSKELGGQGWWGVNESNLRAAVNRLQSATKQTTLSPSSKCLQINRENSSPHYCLNTRSGEIKSKANSEKSIQIHGISMSSVVPWDDIYISEDNPDSPLVGSAWIKPEDVKVISKDTTLEVKNCASESKSSVSSETETCFIVTKFDLEITTLSGSKEVTLEQSYEAQIYNGTDWEPTRGTNTVRIVVPSADQLTTIIVPPTGSSHLSSEDDDQTFQLNGPAPCNIFVFDGVLDHGHNSFSREEISVWSDTEGTITAFLESTTTAGMHFIERLSFTSEDTTLIYGSPDYDTQTEFAHIIVPLGNNGATSNGLILAIEDWGEEVSETPSMQDQTSILGQYESKILKAIQAKSERINNLLQVVLSPEAPDEWGDFTLEGPLPFYVPRDQQLGGMTSLGVSPELQNTPEWTNFMCSLEDVLNLLYPDKTLETWMSRPDPSILPLHFIKNYINSHRLLIEAAETASTSPDIRKSDRFWASYPLSLFITDSHQYNIQAMFLSPLHPARLGWTFTVARTSRILKKEQPIDYVKYKNQIKSLIEGSNLPAVGVAPRGAGAQGNFISVPLDLGEGNTFIGWSALSYLSDGYPALNPADFVLPWGSSTGINDTVVNSAIQYYLRVFAASTSLTINLSTPNESPRSTQIDNAIIRMLSEGDRPNEQKIMGSPASLFNRLPGGIRVKDSSYRLGRIPSKDSIEEKVHFHTGAESSSIFEWTTYDNDDPDQKRPYADISFVENSTIAISLQPSNATDPDFGDFGLLPFRRHIPKTVESIGNGRLLEHLRIKPSIDDADILGISSLISAMEPADINKISSEPNTGDLGLNPYAKWEVFGTFHIDPVQISWMIAHSDQFVERFLWEWKPAWLNQEQNEQSIQGRPYFILTQVPKTFRTTMDTEFNINETQFSSLIKLLGREGISFASLTSKLQSQAACAIGFYHTLMLFNDKMLGIPENPSRIFRIIPIDPLTAFIESLIGESFDKRGDFLGICINKYPDSTHIKIIPIETKYYKQNPDTSAAKNQLKGSVESLTKLKTNMSQRITPMHRYITLRGLAMLIDLAFSLRDTSEQTTSERLLKQNIIDDILRDKVDISVAPGVIAAFDLTGTACNVSEPDRDGIRVVSINPNLFPEFFWPDTNVNFPLDAQNIDGLKSDISNLIKEICECSGPVIIPPYEQEHKITMDSVTKAFIGYESLTSQTLENPQNTINDPESEGQISTNQYDQTYTTNETKEDNTALEDPSPLKNDSTSPAYTIGAEVAGERYSVIGKFHDQQPVALDLDQPKSIGVFGYMGTGKSYLLGNLLESATQHISGINELDSPLASVVFNYRSNYRERFELSSMRHPNDNVEDIELLEKEFNAKPLGLSDMLILRVPGLNPRELERREQEYDGIEHVALQFRPRDLDVEDWSLLMGHPGTETVYSQWIRHTLSKLDEEDNVNLENLESELTSSPLNRASAGAAQMRLEFANKFISESGLDFSNIIKPGRLVVVDLRSAGFDKDDAMRFFLVCANQISRVEGFNKLVIFDEAHEYLDPKFSDRIETRLRYRRHEGSSYVFASQDIESIPLDILRLIETQFVFDLGTPRNAADLKKEYQQYKDVDVNSLEQGHAYVTSTDSTDNLFSIPREITVRPRVTRHGGQTQIFNNPS